MVASYEPWENPKGAHPFESDELVQTRWEQRKILVTIPDEIVSGALEHSQVDQVRQSDSGHGPVVESGLRSIAAQLIDDNKLGPILADTERALVATKTFRFLNENHPSDYPLGPNGPVLRHFLAETQAGMTQALPLGDKRAFLEGLALVLIWADLVADDGHRDPRLRDASS